MSWYQFMDMHSGGDQKLDWAWIFIEADSEADAVAYFESRFHRDPSNVTCECCGEDYIVTHEETLDECYEYEGDRKRKSSLVIFKLHRDTAPKELRPKAPKRVTTDPTPPAASPAVQRYSLKYNLGTNQGPQPYHDGELVKHADHLAALDAMRAERDALDRLAADLNAHSVQIEAENAALTAERDRLRVAMTNARGILYFAVDEAPLSACGPLMTAAGNAFQELSAALATPTTDASGATGTG